MLNQYSDKYSKRNIDMIVGFNTKFNTKDILVKVIVSEETLGTNFR